MNNISICIPVYNCNIKSLVDKLLQNCTQLSIDFELIIIDDASQQQYKATNTQVADNQNIKFIYLPENIGRSAIRNLFLKYAQFDNLLFLDCDSVIINHSFIANYVLAMQSNYQVICGGRKYGNKPSEKQYLLRWKYGINRECKSPENRTKNKYSSFISNNFLVKKTVLQQIKFDERLRHYGHEDSLFAYNLMQKNIEIMHIYNPTIHDFNETATEFIEKTQFGIHNLIYIHKQIIPSGDFAKINKLLRTYDRLRKAKLIWLINVISLFLQPVLLFLLKNGFLSLFFFDLYKLLYLSQEYRKKVDINTL